MSKKAEGFSLRFVLINTGNISRKVLSKVLRSFDKNFERLQEEIFSDFERRKNIRVRDRATLFNLLIGLNGYTVCSGVIDKKLNGKDIIAVPLADESDMRIGYITHRKGMLSRLGTTYLEALQKYLG